MLVAVVVVAGLALAVAAALALGMGRGRLAQPLAFSHRLHVDDLGAECTDCHRHALTAARATIPNVEVCADCHDEALTESPEEARLVELIREGQPIPWWKVYSVPDDVYFSHRRHAALGGLECETCHGEIQSAEEPVTRRAVAVTMEGCILCHDRQGVSNDCIDCHR